MLDRVYKDKANQIQLNDLHNKVAEELGKGLDDPKVLSLAINFLKNNNITADLVESSETMSLKDSIISIANNKDTSRPQLTVEEMLAVFDDA